MAIAITFNEQRPNGGGGQYKITMQQPTKPDVFQEAYTKGCLTSEQYNTLAMLWDGVSPSWFSINSVYSKTLTHAQASSLWSSFPQIQQNLSKCEVAGVAWIEPDYSVLEYIESTGTPQLSNEDITSADKKERDKLLSKLPTSINIPGIGDVGMLTAAILGIGAIVALALIVRLA